LRFEPAGMTDDADIRMAQSIMDYIFRRLALDYMPFEARSEMGLFTASERARALETGEYTQDATAASADTPKAVVAAVAPVAAPKAVEVKIEAAPLAKTIGSSSDLLESMGIKSDAPLCMTCGVKMRMSGACFVCEGCGNTSGCS
jgi:ribonucleoside-diphosphate reductase alpha chain